MSEKCKIWQQKLDDCEDGVLPPEEWGTLEDHLAHCPLCSERFKANSVFKMEVETSVSELSAAASNQFDNSVLSAIKSDISIIHPSLKPSYHITGWFRDQIRRSTFAFLGQMAGGALIAACITTFCLTITIQPAVKTRETTRMLQDTNPISAIAPTHPVPMESLLITPSPKSALLWSKTPPISSTLPEDSKPPRSTSVSKPAFPDRQGALQSWEHIG